MKEVLLILSFTEDPQVPTDGCGSCRNRFTADFVATVGAMLEE